MNISYLTHGKYETPGVIVPSRVTPGHALGASALPLTASSAPFSQQ